MKCCFIGHRDCPDLKKEIYDSVKVLMVMGVEEFYSGGMGDFDKLCEDAVKNLGGTLTYALYSAKQIRPKDKLHYDHIVCPLGVKEYTKSDIPKRNQWMVDQSDVCLCYVCRDGGAKHTLDYAVKEGKKIVNLYV